MSLKTSFATSEQRNLKLVLQAQSGTDAPARRQPATFAEFKQELHSPCVWDVAGCPQTVHAEFLTSAAKLRGSPRTENLTNKAFAMSSSAACI